MHCQTIINSPVIIRQPTFTRGEFDIMMDVDMSDAFNEPVRAWKGYTEVEKQVRYNLSFFLVPVLFTLSKIPNNFYILFASSSSSQQHFEQFRSGVESYSEINRHNTLILDRNRVLNRLQFTTPSHVFGKTNNSGLISFYGMVPLELKLGLNGNRNIFSIISAGSNNSNNNNNNNEKNLSGLQKFFELYFNYFILIQVKEEEEFENKVIEFRSNALKRLKEEVKILERNKVTGWELIQEAMTDGLKLL